MAEFERFAAAMGSDQQPPSVKGQNTTDGRKGKKRRAKKAAKVLRAQREREALKRGAPESSHAASQKRRR